VAGLPLGRFQVGCGSEEIGAGNWAGESR